MIRLYQACFASLLAVALSGCADLRWHREGASATALESDLADCQAQARVRASHFSRPFAPDFPRMMGFDALGRPIMGQQPRHDTDRFLMEHDFTRVCMQARGYYLVQAERKQVNSGR